MANADTDDEKRRVKIAYIDEQELLGCFIDDPLVSDPGGMWHWVTRRLIGVPEGSKVVAVHYSFERQAFGFRIYHPTFEKVNLGQLIDHAQLQYQTVRLAVVPPAAEVVHALDAT